SLNGRYGIFRRGRADHSDLMPANLITFPHFSVSAAMKFVNSAGELANTADPKSEIRALIFGSARATLISLLSLSTISAGVAFGAPTPIHPLASQPGTSVAGAELPPSRYLRQHFRPCCGGHSQSTQLAGLDVFN